MSDPSGRRVLITGASSGIGAATAEAFAREGARLVLLARSEAGLEAVAARVRAQGAEAHVVPCDLADRAAIPGAVDAAVRALGGLDVLVANAAAMVFGRFDEVPPEAFDRTIAVTFLAQVDLVRAALPHLADGGGAIVATGSLMSRVPLPNFGSYAAAKHALRGFLNSLRVELRSAGVPVSVSLVHPGTVGTPLWNHVTSAIGRLPRPVPEGYSAEEVARAIVRCAARPRREFTLGLEARAIELGYGAARPVGEAVLGLAGRYYRSRAEPAPEPGMLWAAVGTGETRGMRVVRPSLWARLRLR